MPCEKIHRKYCSRKCEDEHKKQDNYFVCKRCGEHFYSSHQRQFCSKTCSNLYIARQKTQETLRKIQEFAEEGGSSMSGLQEKGISSSYASTVLLRNPSLRDDFQIGKSFWEEKFENILKSVIQ